MTNINIKTVATGRSDVYRMPPDEIHIKDEWNSRNDADPENEAHIEALAVSIMEVGVKQPLTVYQDGGKFFVSDGHCRIKAVWRAIERGAEIKSVPVMTEERYSSEADRVFSQIVRNSGKPLAPIEQGRVFKRLLAFGWTVADIAKRSGINAGWVKELLELQASAVEIQDMVSTGRISSTLAIQTLRTDGEKAGEVLAGAVATAEAQGRTRATKKHIGGADKGPSKTDRLRALLSGQDGVMWEHWTGIDKYQATFTADQYAEFRSLIGF
ncbi:ParB-like chromosome segregation protein Spo0J [Rhizobium azibense]|nr:ParB-like chromosome segregation protein Spo0J [Rhizobium azibense]